MQKAPATFRQKIRTAGLKEIDKTLQGIEQRLISCRLGLVEVLVLEGRCRELRAARWLLSQVLYPQVLIRERAIANPPNRQRGLWQQLEYLTRQAMSISLENLTPTPLEIDILNPDSKMELLEIILQELKLAIADLENSQVSNIQLLDKVPTILRDLWQGATAKFFGKYYTLEGVEIVPVLLKEQTVVTSAILSRIPFTDQLFSYLLFSSNLLVDQVLYESGSAEAIARGQLILTNLLIQVANAVIQPLLNHFANADEIKQRFYKQSLVASREVERFRNNLSWHYRLQQNWGDAQAVYESRYQLFTFTSAGINQVQVYAPRSRELAQLKGIPLVVTLLLELQDAIIPRLKTLVTIVGASLVYVLKNVIGRGLGLIGKGIIQGIGDSVIRRGDRL